jgi:thiol:disulfide interchange protein DsbD
VVENIATYLEGVVASYSALGMCAAFLAGIVASFSPCIYPLIPVTLGIIGAYSVSSKGKGFLLSLIFVLGIASVYTALGIISASLGIFFGQITAHPISYAVVGTLLLLFGLSQFEIIRIPFLVPQLTHKSKKSYLSVFFSGMVSGIVALSCILPVLGTILSIIALKKNVFYGAFSLFFFALGYGVILLVLGTFTSLISKLPKTGGWLIIIKRCVGIILISTSIYFFIKVFTLL